MRKPLVIIVLIITLFSCHKKDQQSDNNEKTNCDDYITRCDYAPIFQQMNGFFFLPLSYWVYKNDSLNALDSVVISSENTGCEVAFSFMGLCYRNDYYLMNYYSSYSKTTYYDIIEGGTLMRNYHPSMIDSWKGWILFTTNGNIDSIKVGNNTFYNVLMSTSYNTVNNTQNITAYTAKDIGIVKTIIQTQPKQVWNLVRWKIYK